MHQLTKVLMLSIALIFDIIEMILKFLLIGFFINPILTVIEYLIFMTWFWLEGVDFLGKGGGGAAMGVTFVTEMLPIIGALPGLTLGVYLTIRAHEKKLSSSPQSVGSPDSGGNVIRPSKRSV